MKFIKLYTSLKLRNDRRNKYTYKKIIGCWLEILKFGSSRFYLDRRHVYIFLSCSYINILDLSWREMSWRSLLCVRRRRGIEVKFCLDDDHYVASLGYICDVGSHTQQVKYVNILITWKTLCVVWGFWMTCTVHVLTKHSASSVNDYTAQFIQLYSPMLATWIISTQCGNIRYSRTGHRWQNMCHGAHALCMLRN
jgi:hypothetical protein